jgi:hypothetical protein
MRWKRGNRLRLVCEDEVSPGTREILSEVRESLGLPVVPSLYRAYAAVPGFLEVHWEAFRPVVESRQFFLLGARLAAESYTRAHNYFEVWGVPAEAGTESAAALPISQVLDYYQYLDPLLLLITAAQMQAFEGQVGQSEQNPEAAQHPEFPVAPRLLSDAEATPTVQRIWGERRRILELAFISDEHRALATWPDFYQGYWGALKELLRSPVYADCQYRIGESAMRMAREMPRGVETSIPQLLDAGLDEEEVSSLSRMNEAFMQALTGLVLDVSFARIGYDGGTRAGAASLRSESEAVQKKPTSAGSPTRAA